MKNIFAVMFVVFLIGAGCTSATPEQSVPSANEQKDTPLTDSEQKDVSNTQWQHYSNVNTDHAIEFDYPKGYEVQRVETDSFTGYDIREIHSSAAKIRIIMTRDDKASQVFLDSLKGGEYDGLFTTHADVHQNSLYVPEGKIHVAGFSSLDSVGLSTFVLDEQPSHDLSIAKHVYQTLQLVNKKQ